jgi:RNA polymerase sigma-70 factor (ECF subfamily)
LELEVQATNEKLGAPMFGADAFVTGQARAPASPDGELVVRARAGDRAAEEALYRRHVKYIAGLVARLLGDRVEAEDCVQEAFAIALEHLSELRDDDAVRAWIAQIAVSQVRRRFRRRRLLRILGLDRGADDATLETFAWSGATPEVHAELAKIWACLSSVPTEERLAWSLRHVEGHALDEVAAACCCSLATVKRRISAAEARMRARLGAEAR